MIVEIGLTLFILSLAVLAFVTERLRMDLVALLVLVSLVITNLVTPAEALSGFSNPAVVTIWAVFILSAGLSATGVATVIGRQVLRLSGQGESHLLLIIMLTAALLSAFMNNVGVAALLLPVVLMIARQTHRPPSKLLMPLAIGCLLGGLTTLIGTPSNILASTALRAYGLEPFRLFDFAPVGMTVLLAGVAFMLLIGRRLLPERNPVQTLSETENGAAHTRDFYGLEERFALITLPPDSPLAGKSLAESRIGRTLGLTILGLQRHGRKQLDIHPDTTLAGNDRLLVLGRLSRLEDLNQNPYFLIEDDDGRVGQLFSQETGLAELKIKPHSPFIGKTITDIDMRRRYHFNVLAIRQNAQTHRTNLQKRPLAEGDMLLLQGDRAALIAARLESAFQGTINIFLEEDDTAVEYRLQERLLTIRIPANSPLVGQSLTESHLGDLFGLVVLGILRGEQTKLAPSPDRLLQADDLLLVEGKPEELAVVRGLQSLIIQHRLQPEQVELETEDVGLAEAVLSPHTTVVNKTLRDIQFRDRYGLSVLAIWRSGQTYRSDLGQMPLQFGDAFLLYGPRQKINLLSRESDFLVLTEDIQEPSRRHKAPLAVAIMAAVVLSVLIGWLPIAIAAVAGAALMVLSGCLSMEEAYRQIDWRVVFLIAGMLPLGIALEQTGAAQFMADGMVALVGDLGSTALLTGLFVLTSLASQFIPNPVVTVLMAPIAINIAGDLGVSPYALTMVIALAASASFMSPVSHPVNVLVMGPGGYRFKDYIKVGLPLTLVVLLVTLLVLPLFWPLQP